MTKKIPISGAPLKTVTALKREVIRCCETVKVQPSQLRVQKMTRKWASCSTAGWITLAEDLLNMPRPFQQVVIVHELVHLQIPNHGRLFKSMMNSLVPGWDEILRKHGNGKREL
jgi:predicted metal-dependent hydrolase